MRVEFELNADDYVQMTSRFGVKADGIMATVALLTGVNLLISAIAHAPSWVLNILWIVMIVAIWLGVLRRVRRPNRKPSRFITWGIRIAAVLLWTLIAVALLRNDSEANMGFGFLLIPIFLIAADFLSTRLLRGVQRMQWRSMEHLHGPRAFEVNETGFVIVQPQATSTYAWSAVRNVEQTKDLILLRLASAAFLMIPKRAFFSEQDRDQFVLFVQSRILPTAALATNAT